MSATKSSLKSQEILDTYFLENRARLLEIASFLDRLDRAADAENGLADYRHRALLKGIALLLEPGPGRTGAVQLSFSDPTEEPIASAVGLKATGAWPGGEHAGD